MNVPTSCEGSLLEDEYNTGRLNTEIEGVRFVKLPDYVVLSSAVLMSFS